MLRKKRQIRLLANVAWPTVKNRGFLLRIPPFSGTRFYFKDLQGQLYEQARAAYGQIVCRDHVSPCHCSGDQTRRLFSELFAGDYIETGVGKSMKVPPLGCVNEIKRMRGNRSPFS